MQSLSAVETQYKALKEASKQTLNLIFPLCQLYLYATSYNMYRYAVFLDLNSNQYIWFHIFEHLIICNPVF